MEIRSCFIVLILIQCSFHAFAATASRDSVTDAELQTLSEALLAADINNCANLVTVNQQGSTSFHSHRDNAPLPLLTVQSTAYSKPTIEKLLPLHNNYVARVSDAEVVTTQETQEETAFLDAIMPTSVMKKAEKFLVDKGFITTRRRLSNGSYRNNNRAFRDAIHQIWFGLYSRENNTLGSSGFEHVFLGEIKNEKVQGFHNWVFFSKEEQNNNLNYKGKIGPNVSLGDKGMIVKHKFDWNSKEKPISSMFVGTSPEFEIALYSVCFYTRPGSRCPVKLNGKNVSVATHYLYRQGKRYVGSAFPDI
ncbi:unnamed protein product [Orchesella dallaii]|uniref:EndoU domain-containing protein n=1 Tax=Orchesella dallaii TaxID=48710 RepID=A0ABP1QT71_9HEXA